MKELNYERLWAAGGYYKDNPLENTIGFILKKARQLEVPRELAETVINEVFAEVEAGKQFPLDKCPCGCGIDKSGTAITHEMLKKLFSLNREFKVQEVKDIQNRHIEKLRQFEELKVQKKGRIKRAIKSIFRRK